MWQRNAFNGKCQVIIQAGKTPGKIILEAKSNGLRSGHMWILAN
jgi:beta-galactosidase